MDQLPSQPELSPGKKLLFRAGGIALMLALVVLVLEGGTRVIINRQLDQFEIDVANDPANPFNLFQTDPDLGWFHIPGSKMEINGEGGVTYTVQINQAGLYDQEYDYPPPADGFRVLVLGDSYIEGMQVPLYERSFQQLEDCYGEQLTTPYEIIEAGVMRYSPIQYRIFYQKEGHRYQPDVVITTIYLGNDLEEMHPASPHGYIPALRTGRDYYMLDADGKLVLADEAGWRPSERRSSARERLYFFLQKYSYFYRYFLPNLTGGSAGSGGEGAILSDADLFQTGYESPIYADTWPILEAILLDLRAEVEADGAEFAVVIAPHMYSIYPEWHFADRPEDAGQEHLFDPYKLENRLVGILEAHEITYLSLTPALEAAAPTADPLYFHDNVHWAAAGHDAVTGALAGWFAEQGWGDVVRCPTPEQLEYKDQ